MPKKPHTDTTRTYYALLAKQATDAALLEHLANARTCAELIPQPDPTQLEAGIAELEAEVARRGLEIPDPVREPIPPQVALRSFVRGVAAGDVDRVRRTLPWLDVGGLWKAFRRVRGCTNEVVRTECLQALLYTLDCRVFSREFAGSRGNALLALGFDRAEYDAFVEQCIVTLFATMVQEEAN
jgi:hypothetical protein